MSKSGLSRRLSLRVWVFHDERKNYELKGMSSKLAVHSLLAVPELLREETPLLFHSSNPLSGLWKAIERECRELGVDDELHFNKINGKKWGGRDQASLNVIKMLISALRHKGAPSDEFEHPDLPPLFCRWGVLVYPDDGESTGFYSGDPRERAQAHFETFLRFILKGLLHYGFQGIPGFQFRVEVLGVVLDGREHLYREVDRQRVVEKLRGDLKEDIAIAEGDPIIYTDSDHRNSDNPAFSRLIQANDLLLGAVTFFLERFFSDEKDAWEFFDGKKESYGLKPLFRTELGAETKKALVAWPVVALMRKVLERKSQKSLHNSGHYRSFTLSRVVRGEGNRLDFQSYQDFVQLKEELPREFPWQSDLSLFDESIPGGPEGS